MPDINRIAVLAGIDPERVYVWRQAGFFERVPQTTDAWVARAHLLAQLEKAGVPAEVLRAADREDMLARAYVFEFLQVARQGQNPLRQVVEVTGLEEQLFLRLCDALGIDDASVFTDGEVEMLEALAEALREGLPPSAALELCELWGSQMRFIAHAESISYDANIARRVLGQARSPLEGAAMLASLTRAMLRAADLFPRPLHRRHLLQAINLVSDTEMAAQAPAEALPPGEVRVAIGFVDLTGFTSITEREGDLQALAYTRRLERVVRAALQNRQARVVKRLGDGFMLASGDCAALIDVLLRIVSSAAEREDMPTARAGLGWGRAVSRAGDYFGHTVNIAARVMEQAEPSEVLVTEEVVNEAEGPFAFREPRDVVLRGVRQPVRLWRAEPMSPRPPARQAL